MNARRDFGKLPRKPSPRRYPPWSCRRRGACPRRPGNRRALQRRHPPSMRRPARSASSSIAEAARSVRLAHLPSCRQVRKYRTRRLERFLTEQEFRRLGGTLDALEAEGGIPVHAAAALRLLMLTGCRCGEIVGLRWEDVHLESNEVRLADSKTGPRNVSLSPAAVRVLADLPRPAGNPWVIAGAKPGARLPHITYYWYRVRKRAGLEDVRLHDMRHSFASRALALGVPLPMIPGCWVTPRFRPRRGMCTSRATRPRTPRTGSMPASPPTFCRPRSPGGGAEAASGCRYIGRAAVIKTSLCGRKSPPFPCLARRGRVPRRRPEFRRGAVEAPGSGSGAAAKVAGLSRFRADSRQFAASRVADVRQFGDAWRRVAEPAPPGDRRSLAGRRAVPQPSSAGRTLRAAAGAAGHGPTGELWITRNHLNRLSKICLLHESQGCGYVDSPGPQGTGRRTERWPGSANE